MPSYTYKCLECDSGFEIICSIAKYKSHPLCDKCKSKNTERCYLEDISTISGSVKKADSELKTIGDLANRNRDRMSDDHKKHLHKKHNEYKEQNMEKPLPKGMSRIEKPKTKIKWR